jgi:lipoprotein-anchoring transpeptidase ErfK/SrfK
MGPPDDGQRRGQGRSRDLVTVRRFPLVFVLFLLAGCTPFSQVSPPGASQPAGTVKGAVAFVPADGATELDPAQTAVSVKPSGGDASLKSVSVAPEGGDPLPNAVANNQLEIRAGGLKTDTRYVVTAVATVSHKGGADTEETQTVSFSTATTPKVVATNPLSVGPTQSVVVMLQPPASAVTVEGPVKSELGPDGLTITVIPETFKQGETYSFNVTARNQKGVAGSPQAISFNTLPPATATVYPDRGSTNQGVAIPLTLTLSAPPADRTDFVTHLAVTASAPAAPVTGAGSCTGYGVPAVGAGPLPVSFSWTSDRRVRLTPKTPDGYWPAQSTISLRARVGNVLTTAGNVFGADMTSSFVTGDKRVVDVDLSGQKLTTCKNGVQDRQFLISSGATAHPTYTGSFYIYRRVADEEMKSPEGPFAPDYYDIKHVPWTQYFDGGAALHGAWWHNNFGHPMSHGCVNVQTPTENKQWPKATPEAEYLWNFDYLGDPVLVHGVTPGLAASAQPSD